jgi:hypothetical protein
VGCQSRRSKQSFGWHVSGLGVYLNGPGFGEARRGRETFPQPCLFLVPVVLSSGGVIFLELRSDISPELILDRDMRKSLEDDEG